MEEFTCCKLEIFVPESHLEAIEKALWSVDAGHIGKYDHCLSYSPVTGCWRPLPGTTPYLGEENVQALTDDIAKFIRGEDPTK